ncbi:MULTISPECIES: very short patch repair endonuclease [unclassified Duganella]|uniref:very short patch repair endonuclease n=1 Tax=unclassified Duganella TaxID=2636909 RepID=UPI000E345EE8|nr:MULTISPECIES: very short patch repair endonuclease [unclassified Duganella]RFP08000.1 DNA mismatch endonuclease Vsr [Duganella sp. BJB475]RFP23841.1 DNA mismatch endonuclease Vsr [Duganella sp. BJB476]
MVDVHDRETRSRNMSAIRSKNTKPELQIRRWLHAAGFRFRLHRNDLPGRPDLVLAKYRAVILIHGCFWHGHDCHMFKIPNSRREFWLEKINANRDRDARDIARLFDAGWRVMTVWECSMKGTRRRTADAITAEIADWLNSNVQFASVTADNVEQV